MENIAIGINLQPTGLDNNTETKADPLPAITAATQADKLALYRNLIKNTHSPNRGLFSLYQPPVEFNCLKRPKNTRSCSSLSHVT